MQGQAGKSNHGACPAGDRNTRLIPEIAVQLVTVILPFMRVEVRLKIEIARLNEHASILDGGVIKRDPNRQIWSVIKADIGAVLVPGETGPVAEPLTTNCSLNSIGSSMPQASVMRAIV